MSRNQRDLLDISDDAAMLEADREELRILADAVAEIGLDVAAGATGLGKPHIVSALKGDAGRYLDTRHRARILRFASAERRRAYYNVRLRLDGMHAVPMRERTWEERCRDLEYEVAVSCGKSGADAVERNRSRP
jgi:hypothetical protein